MNGGADSDHMFGGAGDDNMDGGTGNDILYGGDGSDRLVADIEGDRLIDWFGPHNLFVQPKNGYGRPTVIVSPSPWVRQFLLDLAAADGAKNPNDEIAVVIPGESLQKDNVGPGTFAATLAEGSVINFNSTDAAKGQKK